MPVEAFATPLGLLIIFGVGVVAAAINTVAGGGSLISFPTLVGLGLPALPANATNSVALWPGSLAGAIGFLNKLGELKRHLKTLIPATLVGAALGAWLLVATPSRTFDLVVPFLVLMATLLLAFQKRIRAWTTEKQVRLGTAAGVSLQFLVALYGGYFGAGMGILMLALLASLGDGDLHELNAVKNWLGVGVNLIASIVLVFQGLVVGQVALAMAAGSVVGGFAAARISQKIDAEKLRIAIVVYGFAMSGWFFWRMFVPS